MYCFLVNLAVSLGHLCSVLACCLLGLSRYQQQLFGRWMDGRLGRPLGFQGASGLRVNF